VSLCHEIHDTDVTCHGCDMEFFFKKNNFQTKHVCYVAGSNLIDRCTQIVKEMKERDVMDDYDNIQDRETSRDRCTVGNDKRHGRHIGFRNVVE
jgi:uncharacterized protein YutE (UPF0331/DUF86 family)